MILQSFRRIRRDFALLFRGAFFIPTFASDLSCSNVAALKIRAYDLYFFIFGVYHLVPRSGSTLPLRLFRPLAGTLPLHLDLLSARHRSRRHLGCLFHLCCPLRHPNPIALCQLRNQNANPNPASGLSRTASTKFRRLSTSNARSSMRTNPICAS